MKHILGNKGNKMNIYFIFKVWNVKKRYIKMIFEKIAIIIIYFLWYFKNSQSHFKPEKQKTKVSVCNVTTVLISWRKEPTSNATKFCWIQRMVLVWKISGRNSNYWLPLLQRLRCTRGMKVWRFIIQFWFL